MSEQCAAINTDTHVRCTQWAVPDSRLCRTHRRSFFLRVCEHFDRRYLLQPSEVHELSPRMRAMLDPPKVAPVDVTIAQAEATIARHQQTPRAVLPPMQPTVRSRTPAGEGAAWAKLHDARDLAQRVIQSLGLTKLPESEDEDVD